ncbi:hypothetical protein JQ628_26615 [Bradyrhizobium lablabi]|uniref:hypothetical protein n=1 Tax=Bradyrhizobium lablabi TaxID=722472 RepID=UPI001BA61278|nr:hypothetical protein [Bradyrhizobium lablabi]MBR1125121.1 hypothetical protein [Bradyrhizobium lablabi]
MKWAIGVAVIVAVGVIAFKIAFPSYSYRYRLQISLSVDEKIYAGSSTIEVTWKCGPKIAGIGRCTPSLGGQAAVIDLGPRGVVVAALRSGETFSPITDRPVDATALCANAFGHQSTDEQLPELPRLTGRRDLSPSNFPRLIWFPNPADMKSAQKIVAQNVASVLGPTAHITEAFVEITKDPIVVDIPKQLPWFPALLVQKGKMIGSEPGQFRLIYNMFVGENS